MKEKIVQTAGRALQNGDYPLPEVTMTQTNEAATLSDLPELMRGLLSGESDEIADLANAAALIYDTVPDVHAFPDHIACDSVSASAMVVSLRRRPAGRSLSQSLASKKESDATDACLSITLNAPCFSAADRV